MCVCCAVMCVLCVCVCVLLSLWGGEGVGEWWASRDEGSKRVSRYGAQLVHVHACSRDGGGSR